MNLAFTPKLLTAWQEGYSLSRLRADVMAGLTVAIVALPLAMALAIASGASPDKGLVTAIVAGFLISALGGSRVQVGGPTGAFVVVIAGVIAEHGYAGLVLATGLAGLVLIVAGYAGVGRLMKFVPMPVVTGFTAGHRGDHRQQPGRRLAGAGGASGTAGFHRQVGGLSVGAAYRVAAGAGRRRGVARLILVLRRINPRLPGYLIAIVCRFDRGLGAAAAGRYRRRALPGHADRACRRRKCPHSASPWSAMSCRRPSPSPFSPGSRRCFRRSSPMA